MTDFIIATLVYIVFGGAVLGLVWALVTWNLWKVEMLDSKDLMGDDIYGPSLMDVDDD